MLRSFPDQTPIQQAVVEIVNHLDTSQSSALYVCLNDFAAAIIATVQEQSHIHEIDRGAFHEQTGEGFYVGEDARADG